MKRFLIHIASLLIITLLILEIVLQTTGWATHSVPKANVDGNFMLKPGETGHFRSGGRGEIDAEFRINPQGYNSAIDYSIWDSSVVHIAIIGDSYIEGLRVDYQNSIGRQLEQLSNSELVVHEYGRSGANLKDYELLTKRAEARGYDAIFVLLNESDLFAEEPSFVGMGHKAKPNTPKGFEWQLPYYLNRNQGLSRNFSEVGANAEKMLEKVALAGGIECMESAGPPLDVLSGLSDNVVILFETGRLNSSYPKAQGLPYIEIDFGDAPYNYGFDSHWNETGAGICAEYIYNYLNKR